MSLAEQPVVRASGADQERLRRHAPILRLDGRELFRPCAVDEYIEACVLADHTGVIDPEPDVAQLDDRWGHGTHLRFIAEENRRGLIRSETRRIARRVLSSRLGRVGLFGRLLDAAFLLSVWIRPCTPRLTAPAAAAKADRLGLHTERVCYGRTVRSGEWLVLHYAWFYAMNDWRTSYRGLNDHEADLEQAWIFCDPADNRPIWVVASNHDNRGPDLRRHWDDPECLRIDGRPVLYAGAGSHALYFRSGDYVSRIDVPGLRWLLRLQRWARGALRIRDQAAERGLGPALGVPFVDTATGDGREITAWHLELLDPARPAFGAFRGLWGLDTGDPTNGERGPSGPKFDRAGKIRLSWADPVGFAGLHASRPPSAAPPGSEVENLGRTINHLEREIVDTSNLLPLVEQTEAPAAFERESQRLSDLLRQRAELEDQRGRLEAGERIEADVRAHLTSPATPLDPPAAAGWLLALWAASSVPLILASVAALFLFDSLGVSTVPLGVAAAFSILEQLVRRHFQAVLRLLVLYLAVASAFVVVSALFAGVVTVSRLVIGGVVAAGAVVLFVANLGELTAVQRRAEAAAETEADRAAASARLEPGPDR